MLTRRGFLGVLATAMGGAALPTWAWDLLPEPEPERIELYDGFFGGGRGGGKSLAFQLEKAREYLPDLFERNDAIWEAMQTRAPESISSRSMRLPYKLDGRFFRTNPRSIFGFAYDSSGRSKRVVGPILLGPRRS